MSEIHIIIPSEGPSTILSPVQWVNKLSWLNIGNKDEAQRQEFVNETFKFQKECIQYGMLLAAKMLVEGGNPMVAKAKIIEASKEFLSKGGVARHDGISDIALKKTDL